MTIDARIAVVIVNYGAADFILDHIDDTLASLEEFRDSRIYIVDNASPNGDLEKLRAYVADERFANVTIIDSGGNIGFAGGNNCAFDNMLKDERPDFVLFLNPDSYPQKGAVAELARVLIANPDVGVAAPRILDENGEITMSHFQYPGIFEQFSGETEIAFLLRLTGRNPAHNTEQHDLIEADWVCGAAFLARMEACTDPPMDDGYFLYFEETDMMRAMTKAGWRILVTPQADFVHIGGLSTGAGAYIRSNRLPICWYHSWRRYFVKQHGSGGAMLAALCKIAGILVYMTKLTVRGEPLRRPKNYLSDFIRHAALPIATGKSD